MKRSQRETKRRAEQREQLEREAAGLFPIDRELPPEPWERPAITPVNKSASDRWCPSCRSYKPASAFPHADRVVCGPCAAPIPMRLPPRPKHLEPRVSDLPQTRWQSGWW
jgi:hypothetical protein